MALLFMDSFDHYATADITEKWTSVIAGTGMTNTINSTGGRRSSGSYRITVTSAPTTENQAIQKTIASGDATCVMGFSFVISTVSFIGATGLSIATIRDGSSAQVTLRLNSSLLFEVRRGTNGGTLLGTSSSGISAGVTAYVEWKILINASTGTVDLRINGVSVLSLTSQNTRNTANSSWTAIALCQADLVANTWIGGVTGNINWDDLYVLDGTGSAPWNTFLGDCRVDPRYPTAEGTTIGWTPLSGTDNALMVDETAPNDDTDYNSAASTSLTDTFVTQDAPAVGATIYGIQHNLSMKKADAGICTVAPVVRHSGVDNVGSSLSPGTSYSYGIQIASVNPGTSAAWIESDFNAAEFGYKRVT